ncbi:MAG TPA: phosphotransferase, partial [Roseiflexaceae bacterium]|nr:phosphotransferase [Roseiflexaceae bacterium]
EALQQLYGPGFAVEDCRVELVDYGRKQRATLRYHVAGRQNGAAEQIVVYGKLTGDGSGALAAPISAALRDWQPQSPIGYRFNVPRVLAWRPELHLSLLEAIPGESLIGDALKAQLRGKPAASGAMSIEQMIDACARIAATLHTSGIQLGGRRTFDDELTSLRRELSFIEPISPELAAQIAATLDQIAQIAAQSQPQPLCFNHGDFTYGQLLFDGSSSGLIDFDSVCQAEPALDLAQFLTYVRVASLKSKLTPEATRALLEQLGRRFLDTYAGALGASPDDMRHVAERVAIYKALSLVRRTLRSWQKFKPERIESALALLTEELAGLAS